MKIFLHITTLHHTTLHYTTLHYTTLHSLCCSILLFTCCDAVQGGQQTICSGYVPHALHVQGALCDDDTLRPVRAAHSQVCQQRPLPPSGRLQHKARYDTTPPSIPIQSNYHHSLLPTFSSYLLPFLLPSSPPHSLFSFHPSMLSSSISCFLTLPCLASLFNAMLFIRPN